MFLFFIVIKNEAEAIHLCLFISLSYRFIALPPTIPSTAEATAMTTFKMVSQRDLLTAITLHTSFPTLYMIDY